MVNEAQFTQLIRDTKAAVLAAIWRYLHPDIKYLVDDVAQETYLIVYKKLLKTQLDTENLHNYLFTIAKHEAFRMNRKEQKQIIVPEPTIDAHTDPAQQEDMKILQDLVLQLDDPFKDVVQLFSQGWSLQDIAQRLKIKIGTVKSRLFRGKKQLNSLSKKGGLYDKFI